ncbi:expressed unknown protein [Seminavis robusta]|uniref:Uncharacterized protein n=1 Tax=Seminavis robusta TaxID=568900 RepID=A0A9N8EBV4_9STRA|nr:expressed unknown protein [Seminavis robusta]|eukprot:Sro943_g222750.1 n/a (132) ;mRNA; r:7266-7661
MGVRSRQRPLPPGQDDVAPEQNETVRNHPTEDHLRTSKPSKARITTRILSKIRSISSRLGSAEPQHPLVDAIKANTRNTNSRKLTQALEKLVDAADNGDDTLDACTIEAIVHAKLVQSFAMWRMMCKANLG